MIISRGQLEEMEGINGNILMAIDHLLDIPFCDTYIFEMIRTLRDIRSKLWTGIVGKNEVNTDYHCAYKHLMLIRTQLKEQIQAYLDNNKDSLASETYVQLKEVEKVLQLIRVRYWKAEDIKDVSCIRCLEDYLKNEHA